MRNEMVACVKSRALAFVQALLVGALMMLGFYAFAALGNAAGLNDGGVRVYEACRPGRDCTLGDL